MLTTFYSNGQIPNPLHRNVEGLAKKFKREYPEDSARTVAIYNWLTGYLHYDLKAFKKYKFKVNSYSLNKVLYRRKAMCAGFSNLFQNICLKSGIKCVQLQGYTFENPEDPYILYYYHNHAWNSAEINGHWFLFDPTFDNGFVKTKKRVIRRFLNKTLGVPMVYSKTKFIHKATKQFLFRSGDYFIHSHFPVVANGTLIKEQVKIESFAKRDILVSGTYNPSPYPTLAQLNIFADNNQTVPLKVAADQSHLINKKNNLVKAINYYNSFYHDKRVKSSFNRSDVDTVLKYAPLFKHDNIALHNINSKRINEEHKNLQTILKSTNSHNIRLASHSNQKAIRNNSSLLKTSQSNSRKISNALTHQLKMNEYKSGSIKKYDSIPFAIHIEQYNKTLHTGDSLILIVRNEYKLLDSLLLQTKHLTKTFHNVLNKRINLLNVHRMNDMHLATYPAMNVISTAIDSLTSIIDDYKRLLTKTENEYYKLRQQSIRNTTVGQSIITREYIKIQTGVTVQEPYSKDSLVSTLLDRYGVFTEVLLNLYRHSSDLYLTNISHYQSTVALLKSERKIIQKTINARQMALDFRIKYENTRYNAYQNLILKIANRAQKLAYLKTSP